jgi:hypothetical protein
VGDFTLYGKEGFEEVSSTDDVMGQGLGYPLRKVNNLADDPAFAAVDFNDLDHAAQLDGTELLAADQSGGVKATVQEVAGSALTIARGHNRSLFTGYSRFSNTQNGFGAAAPVGTGVVTTGSQFGGEPYLVSHTGTDAAITQGALIGAPAAIMTTGTTATGFCSIERTANNSFSTARSMETTFRFSLASLPSTQAFTLQIGFFNVLGVFASARTGLSTQGIYFQLDSGSPNWLSVVKNAAGTTAKNSAIAATAPTIYVFKIVYDAVALENRFYLNGALIPAMTITNAERTVTASLPTTMGVIFLKSAGTTAAGGALLDHAFTVETAELEHF